MMSRLPMAVFIRILKLDKLTGGGGWLEAASTKK